MDIQRPLNSTILNDRTLWFDGESTVPANSLLERIMKGEPIHALKVPAITPEIAKYNSLVPQDERIGVKIQLNPLYPDWNIPSEYKSLDVVDYVFEKLDEHLESEGWCKTAYPFNIQVRVNEELELYEELGLFDVLRTLIYVINTLRSNKVVWGVGRGSAVSSYILFLIGVHDVDSIKYDLDIRDFLRKE